MNRDFLTLCQAVVTVSIVSSIRNHDNAVDIRQPFSDTMCEELCERIRECNSGQFNHDFLQCLLLKVTGMSDMTIFQLSTQNCYPGTTHLWTRENRRKGYRCLQKGTVKRPKNTDCKQHNYEPVIVGRETIHVKFHSERLTWDEALKICHSEGSTLAMPDTKAKENAMMDKTPFPLFGSDEDWIWIGLSDVGKNNTFYWLDGSAVSYEHWGSASRKPSHTVDGKDEDCVAAMHKFAFGKQYSWNDIECSNTRPFICQCY